MKSLAENNATKPVFMVLDGNSLVHRAYHAVQPLTTSKGISTNAVYGFVSMLFKLLEEKKPDYLAVTFDYGKKTFRHLTYAAYKGQRSATPDDLRSQFPLVKQVLAAMDIPFFEQENYEADDLIGTLTKLAEDKGLHSLIISGDRDVLQLVTGQTQVLFTRKGISQMILYTPEYIAEEYVGLQPGQLIDLKALEGDPSDNIPGIPSVGRKTAVKLLQQFHSVEELFTRREELPERLRILCTDFEDQIRTNKDLVTIARDVSIAVDWIACARENPYTQDLMTLFRDLEFRSLIKRITPKLLPEHSLEPEKSESGESLNGKAAQSSGPELTCISLNREDAFALFQTKVAEFRERIREEKGRAESPGKHLNPGLAVFFQPDLGADTFWELFFCMEDNTVYHLQIALPFARPSSTVSQQVQLWLEDPELPKLFHDAKPLLSFLNSREIDLQGIAGDTLLAAYLLNPEFAKLSLEELCHQHLNQLLMEKGDLVQSGCQKVHAIFQLHQFLHAQLKEAKMEQLYTEVELPLIPVLVRMERNGVLIHTESLEEMSKVLGSQLSTLNQEIYRLAEEEFNVNSPKQLGHILFEKLQLPVIKKTKTGYSTDVEVLNQLTAKHEIIPLILEQRQLMKLKSTYVDGLRQLVNPQTGKIHTTFNQTITATGRLSSTEPNLQNIPIRLEFGRRIRKFFTASEPGWFILAADYSQIELRALAHFSQDAALIKAFKENLDIHTLTASQVFAVPLEAVTKEMRYRAKAVNFGIVYGISDFGLAKDLGISRLDAKAYIEQYFLTFPGVKGFMEQIVQQAREQGYVSTLLGRRRYLPELFSRNHSVRNFGERAAINAPIQGSAADIIKLAMLQIDQSLAQHQLRTRMLLQVHDELIFEVPSEELSQAADLVQQAMEQALTLSVPLVVDLEIGENWYDLYSLDKGNQ